MRPHGTDGSNAKPSRDVTRHTSQQSSGAAASAAANSDTADVVTVTVGTGALIVFVFICCCCCCCCCCLQAARFPCECDGVLVGWNSSQQAVTAYDCKLSATVESRKEGLDMLSFIMFAFFFDYFFPPCVLVPRCPVSRYAFSAARRIGPMLMVSVKVRHDSTVRRM